MGPIRVLSTSVAWLPWSAAAFGRARDERRPVLLSIAAAWSEGCADMDRASYADPTIATFINEHFVPVRVDADERPDVAERYGLGGWPTTAFLDADGAILAGGTHVAAERMMSVLEQVAAAFAVRDPLSAVRPPLSGSSDGSPLPRAEAIVTPDRVSANVFASFDPAHGGFGTAPKFPLVAPLQLALGLWSDTGDPQYREIVVTSLDAMGWGGLYDEADGGFFHYADAADWTHPRKEKLLETNAALIRLYLAAGDRLGIVRFTARAADALRYVQTQLVEPVDGGWYASHAHAGRVQLVDSAAAMASAALDAASAFDDEGLRQFALTSLERVLLSGYRPGNGAAHVFDGQPRIRGLLADQAGMVAANLDAFETTGNVVYEMMAEELGAYALRVLWDDQHGGFFDSVADPEAIGLMRVRLKPFTINCDFSRALARLARSSGDATFDTRAQETLAAMAPLALEQGPLGAHWVLAARELKTPR